jgi:Tfp pilus assembly protein PilF
VLRPTAAQKSQVEGKGGCDSGTPSRRATPARRNDCTSLSTRCGDHCTPAACSTQSTSNCQRRGVACGFSDALRLDTYRLRMATGTMSRANEYVEMAQLALQAGFPGEAEKVVNEGYARNLLGTGANAASHNQLRAQAKRLAASDAASLQQASAASARSSDVLATMGWALATSGQADKGIPMIEQAIAKGGLKRVEDTRLRLGVAQYQAGRKDAAAQTFKSVQGKDGSGALAHLWALLAQGPAAQGAAPAAAQQ